LKNAICFRIILLSISLIGLIGSPSLILGAKSIVTDSKEKFAIVVLPDTQYYSDNYPWIFDNQTRWIINNKESMNIVFVTHLGDLVDHWWSIEEWDNANASMSRLDGVLPYGVLPGNHDGAESMDHLSNFNNYFGFNRFINESWYGGAFQNINANNFQLFSAGGDDFLIFHIQFDPSDDILLWASNVIDQYPSRRVILSTHNFVHGYGYYSNSRSEIGKKMWEKLVKPHVNQIFLVLSGHYENEVRITSLKDGYFVHQLLSDYQDRPNGGNGWLRIIEFSPINDEISIKTYSPYLNRYETDSNSQFILDEEITESRFILISILPWIIPFLILVITLLASYFLLKRFRKNRKLS
jgi:hypothetical protein